MSAPTNTQAFVGDVMRRWANTAMPLPDLSFETDCHGKGYSAIAGVDEVGRGPLAGPVVAAAVILPMDAVPEGLQDSKKLTEARREALYNILMRDAACGLGQASVPEIDEVNILQASHLAMCRALEALPMQADFALIDGNRLPKALTIPAQTVVKGDAKSKSIAAASIIAKVTRDRIMRDLAQQFPGYGWEKNAGYPTKQHQQALLDIGVTPHHRRSFKPVHNILYQEKSITP